MDHQRSGTRITVVLDAGLLREAMRLTGIRTKREVIVEALNTLIRIREQGPALERLRGAIDWEGDLAEMRKGRVFDGGC